MTIIDSWCRNLENAIDSWFNNPPALPARPKPTLLPNVGGIEKNKCT
jgi:hypothetical protein